MMKTGFAVVRRVGWDDVVLSVHKTQAAAKRAFEAVADVTGYDPPSERIVEVEVRGPIEIIEIFGKSVLRPVPKVKAL